MPKIEAETVRLDHALERLAEVDRTPAGRAQLERFEAVLRSRRRPGQGADAASLADELFAFVMPALGDPTILHGSRYLGLLETFADELANDPRERDEVTHWAALILRHEARKHRLLWQYLNGLVES